MDPKQLVLVVLLLAQSTTHSHSAPTPTHTSTSTYVVQIDRVSMPAEFATLDRWYSSIVATHAPDSPGHILHTYDTVMHGFAVRLTADEARRLSLVPGVSGVYKDRVHRTHTTRSPGFLGLDPSYGAWPDSDFGDGIIIGIVDSGIWPERASFNDTGLGPVRSTWKGKCEHAEGFNGSSLCNNKLVGARAFTAEIDGALTPRDHSGHGTHVSSTAAGSEVQGANLLNFSAGNAFGMAPKARIAMYKACNSICEDSAIVAAIDAAVSDGVDILSLSLGTSNNVPFPDDAMAVALFGADRHGVFVVLSGGNAGPAASSVTNVAPWMTTVGATTQDRVFPAKLRLGNGVVLTGQSLFDLKSGGRTVFRLVNSTCWPKDLTPDAVMGALVVCLRGGGGGGGRSAQKAGAAGIVLAERDSRLWEGLVASTFQIPGLVLSRDGWDVLRTYISSSTYPVASILLECETVTGRYSAPLVAAFSSRGPNALAPALLKPDIVAPGVNILAAWSGEDEYAIISGTSMACPQVAGVAALIMKQHSDWTPAMVRSALMTTAKNVNNVGTAIVDNGSLDDDDDGAATPLAVGAGLVLPQGAIHPGLVYDAGTHDYVDFLCTLNYTAEQMRRFVPELTSCSSRTLPAGVGNLNYPSFVVVFDSHTRVRTLTRTVTKVSEQLTETYNVTVVAPDGVKMSVTPATLEFKNKNQQRSYTVEFVNQVVKPAGAWEFGKIMWESDKHIVVSPVAFTWN
ncbi:subtilisin-like protease SBT1.7 [Lolium rigidum]|uniref:subtilisin-like protease SBT1.7 n=1 Tax=Lolium rigidum TaxID=89674 RepID=UPI001F5D1B60|nr:subtilisin-like protease SBT1.7 [Lolium rigidum]